MTSSFYIVDAPGGEPRGPYTAAQLVGLHMTGKVGDAALIARSGEKQWYAFSTALATLQTVAQNEAAPPPAPVPERIIERIEYVPAPQAQAAVIKSNPASSAASGFLGCLGAFLLIIVFILYVMPSACSAGFKAANDQLFRDTNRPPQQKK